MIDKKHLIYKEDVLAMAWLADECEVVAAGDIEDIPAVDAVPVVRCKDCKYSYGKKYCTNDAWKDEGNTVYIEPDAFCSYGERKNNE